MELSLKGRRAVVTGAARGIGRCIAYAFADAGADVAVIDRDHEGAEETARRCADTGGVGTAHVADLADPDQVRHAIAESAARLGGMDAFVSNAGILRSGGLMATSLQDWDAQFTINARAAFLGIQTATQLMIDHTTGGSIVTVTSNCAHAARKDLGAYCASKSAADMTTRCFALELAEHGIRVNSLCPGTCDTELQRAQWRDLGIGPERQIRGSLEAFRPGIPMGRIATPADVAAMALVLASEASSFVTGQSICVDGGQTTA